MTFEPLLWLHCPISGRCLLEYIIGTQSVRHCRDASRSGLLIGSSGFRRGSEAGSYLRLIDSCIAQLKAQGPFRNCHESKEEEEEGRFRPGTLAQGGRRLLKGCLQKLPVLNSPLGLESFFHAPIRVSWCKGNSRFSNSANRKRPIPTGPHGGLRGVHSFEYPNVT